MRIELNQISINLPDAKRSGGEMKSFHISGVIPTTFIKKLVPTRGREGGIYLPIL